jgi:ABC-type multidrug transport system fused ATPase/permease subunit
MNIKQVFVKSIDAYALVLVLLATVTYPTFSQPPGFFDDDGLMRTSCNPRLLWFVYFNSFSFFLSMTDLLLCLSGRYAPMSICKADPDVERHYLKSHEDLAEFNKQLARSVLFTVTKLLVINVLFVLSLTCCIAAYISAGSAVQQLTISNRLSIIIPGIGGCLLYFLFVVWLFHDFNLFFRSARSGSVVDYFTDFVTMIWFFLFPRRSSCTRERFQLLAQDLAETARQWSVRQLFNKASDEINCYDQNNTPNELNAAEQTSQQQQQRSTETSNNAAAAAAAFRAQQSAEHGSSGGDGSQSQCWPWKNPCKGYLKKLEDKLLHNAPNLSEQQTATTPIEPSVGGDASGSTPIVQEIELVQTEQ